MYIITFYSFKGGVGRTMALVNVAAELVRRGRKVLVVDFDLEAPGLETYEHLHPPGKRHPGIVEYVTQYRQNYQVPDLREFIYETKPIGKKGGHLWVMPAGRRDRAYRQALVNLDWKRLYGEQDGFLLFEDTKEGWKQEYNPDYVLIDSRTGDTDVLGICTRQLPDAVVLMFTPNEQNLVGLKNVCRDIRREAEEGLKKTILLHFVAANLPNLDDEDRILRRHLRAFCTGLNFKQFAGKLRRYESLRLLDQSVVTLHHKRSRLARAYRHLVDVLIKDNLEDRDAALHFLDEYRRRRPWGTGEVPLSPEKIPLGHSFMQNLIGKCRREPLNKIAGKFLDDAEVFLGIAECRVLDGEISKAKAALDRVLALEPSPSDIRAKTLFRRALCKARLKQDGAADDLLASLQIVTEPDWICRIFRELATVAPGRLREAADLRVIQQYPSELQSTIAGILGDTEEGLSRAIDIMRANPNRNKFRELLFRARRWKEVLEILPLDEDDYDPHPALEHAFALWGVARVPPTREVWGHILRLWEENGDPALLDLEVKAWALWGLGRIDEALACLRDAEQQEMVDRNQEPFSYWQYRAVSVAVYMDDCEKMHRFFEGEPLQPAFLGSTADQQGT